MQLLGFSPKHLKGKDINQETQHRFARPYNAWPSWLPPFMVWLVLCMRGEWWMWYILTFMKFWTPSPTAFFFVSWGSVGWMMGLLGENWLDQQGWRAVIHSLRSGWWSVMTITPWARYWAWYCSVTFNSVVNDDTECTLSKSVMGKQLTENVNTSVWRDLNKSEDCVYRNLVSFNMEKWKVLFQGKNHPVQTGKWMAERSAEKGWDVMGNVRLYEPTACSRWE